jgi:hypothetical protein
LRKLERGIAIMVKKIGQGKANSIEFLEQNPKLLKTIEKQVIDAINKED